MNKRTKALSILIGLLLVTSLIITVACDIQNNVQAQETEFNDLPLKTQYQIMKNQKTVTTVKAKAISNNEVVNINDNYDLIIDNKAAFEKGKLYQLTYNGDWLTKVEEVK